MKIYQYKDKIYCDEDLSLIGDKYKGDWYDLYLELQTDYSMTDKEAIEILKCAKAEVEWEYPLDYSIAIDIAIEALQYLCDIADNKYVDSN